MAFAYLTDPEKQFMTKSGTINVDGFLKVFDAVTDDQAVTYKNFSGVENPEKIPLDNNGRAVVIADAEKAYRLEVYDRYGTLMWTTTPLWCLPGGGGAELLDIVSSDGSVSVDKTTVGSVTTYDLSTNVEDSTDLLGWVRCDGGVAVPGTDTWKPTYTAGNILVGDKGVVLTAGQYYHATARVRITKSGVAPTYDDMQLVFKTDDGTDTVQVARKGIVVDGSMGLYQDFEISADVLADADCELCLDVTGKELSVVGIQLLDMEVHRVFSGAPYIPGGVATKPWLEENYQKKLTAGDNITIDSDNVISAVVPEYANADWDATSGQPGYIYHKPDLSIYATTQDVETALADKQDVLTAGDNITIVNNTISATAEPQVNADWDATSGVAEILNKPVIPVVPPLKELVAGTNISIDEGADAVTISATGISQVNADWDATSGVAEILNKPDLSIYAESADLATVATTGSYDDLTDKPVIPAAQVNADWDAVSGVQEILHKPSIPTATSDLQNDSGYITINDVPAQVQTDWDATSGLGQILHKPDLSIYAESADLATVATTGSYDDLTDKPSIPAAQVNADWNAVSGISEILNKPSLATVATTGDYGDLSNTPAIPAIGTITV